MRVDTHILPEYIRGVGRALIERLQQTRPLGSPVEEAAVNLLLAASWLNDRIEQALEPTGISHAQYNVLRILKGAHPGGHPRCDIASRMIDRAPDVTRLLDRLEARGLVERERCPEDARRSVARITRKGQQILAEATEAIAPTQQELARRLGPRAERLSAICESLYGPDL
jgi:DNA-binding MarR family transcriptional regulator